MVTKTANELHDLVKRILVAAGSDEPNARMVAEHLVLANLSGVDSHGVWHVLGYIDAIRDGSILPRQSPAILKATPSSALVTGDWTFGQVACKFATELAIDKAKAQDIAIVGVVQKHHIGRLGHYCEMAAAQGMIGLVVSGGQGQLAPAAMPYGGSRPVLHTNPIAGGFPTGTDDHPVMFDFATSCTSGVKVHNARHRGEKLPHGYIVDKHGQPTDDPEKFFDGGGHAPFGAHKGYAIMMLVEYLGRVFTGANQYADDQRGGGVLRNEGTTLIVFKAGLFQDMASYNSLADEMADRVRAIPPAKGFDHVMMPGDPEATTRRKRRCDGIPIEDDIWATIVRAGEKVGVTA
jgi:LDH2 family malate/lactate/ureidoglycolate dehydrogenase